jgi:hypothetical protein
MATKFDQFLQENKIDPRRLLVASDEIERLRSEDRALRLKLRQSKASDAPKAAAADGEKKKRRSGRPVTRQLIAAVSAGKPVSGPAKTRLLRALNRVLEQKKKSAVELRAIF